jgi:methylmalonyl-CoA mutase cobalamin-binding subunit
MPRQQAEPKILLATFPNEPHSLGLLMADALLASEGATTISLGTELPIAEIADAARAFGASIVCVSLSNAYGLKPAQCGLKDLRDALPSDTALWVGGELSRRLRREANGYVAMSDLNELLSALRVWRAERFASTEAAAVVEELSANL